MWPLNCFCHSQPDQISLSKVKLLTFQNDLEFSHLNFHSLHWRWCSPWLLCGGYWEASSAPPLQPRHGGAVGVTGESEGGTSHLHYHGGRAWAGEIINKWINNEIMFYVTRCQSLHLICVRRWGHILLSELRFVKQTWASWTEKYTLFHCRAFCETRNTSEPLRSMSAIILERV